MLERLGQVVIGLHPEPRLRTAAKCLGQPNCHFGGNSRSAINQVIKGLARDTENLCGFSDGEAKRFKTIVPNR